MFEQVAGLGLSASVEPPPPLWAVRAYRSGRSGGNRKHVRRLRNRSSHAVDCRAVPLPSPLAGEELGERGMLRSESGRLPQTRNTHTSSRKMTTNQQDFAKSLRQNMTDAEQLLWKHLCAHRLSVQKFRRQQPIGPYIVDFVHYRAKLIIECDGGQYNGSPRDQRRDRWLEAQGFKILRFWNHDILNQTESVLHVLYDAITPLSPNPSPARGEGNRGGFVQAKHIHGNTATSPSQVSDEPSSSPLPSRERGRGRGGLKTSKHNPQ